MRHLVTYRPSASVFFVLVIIISPFLLFWRWIFRGEVLYWGTLLLQFWPWHHLVKISLLSGKWPLWNPLLGNGSPLLANLQSAVFYPPNLIYLFIPVEHGLTLSIVFHLLLAGLLMYIYSRSLNVSPFGATVSALAYMFSGYLVGRTQFVPMVNAAAWYPLLLLLGDKLIKTRSGSVIGWLALILALQLFAGHAQLWFYGLWLVGAYIFYRSWQAASREEARQDSTDRERFSSRERGAFAPDFRSYGPHLKTVGQSILSLALAVALSLILAAVQLLPTAEFVAMSPRGEGAERIFALTYSFWPWRLITLLAPDFFGNPAWGTYWGYQNYWEDHAYIGVLPLLLAGTAVWHFLKLRTGRSAGSGSEASLNLRQRDPLQVVPFFGILLPISLVLALGWNTPVYGWVFDTVPGFSFFQGPARLLIWYTVAMAVLAGIGAQCYRSTAENRPHWRRFLAACVAITITGLAGGLLLAGRSLTFLDAVRSLGILLICSILLLLIRPAQGDGGWYRARIWQGAVIGFVLLDLIWAGLPLIPTASADVFSRSIASAEFLKAQPGTFRYFINEDFAYTSTFDQYFRFREFGPSQAQHWQSFKERLVPNFGVYAGLASTNNNDPLLVGHWQRLVEQLQEANDGQAATLLSLMNVGYLITAPGGGNGPVIYGDDEMAIQQVPQALPPAYFVPEASFVSSADEVLVRLTAGNFDSRQEVVIMKQKNGSSTVGSSSIDFEPSAVAIVARDSDQIVLTAQAPAAGFVVLTDTYYPGWQAEIDGQAVPLLQANLAFRAVAVEAGFHEIRFRYRPLTFTFGLWTTAVSGLIIGGLIIKYRLTSRKTS